MKSLILPLILISTSAMADCFERVYTPEHLSSHPKQEVQSLYLDQGYGRGPEGGSDYFRLHAELLRNGKLIQGQVEAECEIGVGGDYSRWVCRPKEQDGLISVTSQNTQATFRHSLLIKTDPNIKFTITSPNERVGETFSLSSYDSTMKVFINQIAGAYAGHCEPFLVKANFLSQARLWNEVALHSVRNDVARPTVTSRNLFHLSSLMWDVYASFDPQLKGHHSSIKWTGSRAEVAQNREIAMSYAAHAFLKKRYRLAPANQGSIFAGDGEEDDSEKDHYLDKLYDRLLLQLKLDVSLKKSDSYFEVAAFGKKVCEDFLFEMAKDDSRESENHSAEPDFKYYNSNILDISQSGIHSPVKDVTQMLSDFLDFGLNPDKPEGAIFDLAPYRGDEFSESLDIDHWVRLNIPGAIDQGGTAQASEQSPLTLFWGKLPTFGDLSEFKDPSQEGVYFDIGSKLPQFAKDPEAVIRANLQVIEFSALLNPVKRVGEINPGAELIDISPLGIGNNLVGTNDGAGRVVNPVTGKPYQPNLVKAADYYRSIAEFWADGPTSETPPGHWNVMANFVMDQLHKNQQGFHWMGQGPSLPREQYELQLYLTLNGALHDAAIVAWGLKGAYQGNRPVMVIRKLAAMAEQDEEFANELVSYSPNLKMVNYIKKTQRPDGSWVTQPVRKLAVKAWRGPGYGAFYGSEIGILELRDWSFRRRDKEAEAEEDFYYDQYVAGVGWILADNWLPYQRQTFVTPPFPGFVSGHSTFSRAAAEVLAGVTGSEYFPGGLAVYPAPDLNFESKVETPFDFHWATYFDASDASGLSRLYGGIHSSYDDLPARVIGSKIGQKATLRAKELFDAQGDSSNHNLN